MIRADYTFSEDLVYDGPVDHKSEIYAEPVDPEQRGLDIEDARFNEFVRANSLQKMKYELARV